MVHFEYQNNCIWQQKYRIQSIKSLFILILQMFNLLNIRKIGSMVIAFKEK